MLTPEARAALVEAVLADPEALWAVRTARVKGTGLIRVAGPWVPAKSEKRRTSVSGDAVWRLDPKGEHLATVHKWWDRCDGVRKPEHYDYHMGDEDEYKKDLAEYKAAVALRAGREWVWKLAGEKTEYAVSKEEALRLADEALTARGVRLVPEGVWGDAQMKRYTA